VNLDAISNLFGIAALIFGGGWLLALALMLYSAVGRNGGGLRREKRLALVVYC
jgi:hypothetical protein